MVIVNHNVTYSNLYISDIVSEHEVSSWFIVNHNVTYSNLYISDIVSEHEVRSWSLSTTM